VLESEGPLRTRLRTGLWRAWHENGALRCEGSFVEGEPFGWWTFWYEHGAKRAEGEMREGKQSGPWNAWHLDGSPNNQEAGIYWEDELLERKHGRSFRS
jgi:antitoxin component YwqK of YwqJK toxin-antitoxin module